uniref:Uncharacterized protein n=1 Tax=Oryza punctata TaxID=4537 RepID=A0A0E0LSY5_ORYPU
MSPAYEFVCCRQSEQSGEPVDLEQDNTSNKPNNTRLCQPGYAGNLIPRCLSVRVLCASSRAGSPRNSPSKMSRVTGAGDQVPRADATSPICFDKILRCYN